MRRGLRSLVGARRPFAGAIAVAVATSLFAAARLLEITASGRGFVREIGGCLAVGLLILVGSRAASVVGRLRESRLPLATRREFLSRAVLGTTLEALLALLLATPALVVAWELGASSGEMARLGLAVLAVVLCGFALGGVAAGVGLPAPTASLAALAVGALILWPTSLGWLPGTLRFPAVEADFAVLFTVIVAAAALGAIAVVRRTRGDLS